MCVKNKIQRGTAMTSIVYKTAENFESDQLRSIYPHHAVIARQDHYKVEGGILWTLAPMEEVRCPCCGRVCKVHSTRYRVVQDVRFFDSPLYLSVPIRFVRCRCGFRGNEQIEWLQPRLKVTNRLISRIQQDLQKQTVQDVAAYYRLDWGTVRNIEMWRLEAEFGQEDFGSPKTLVMDEFAVLKKKIYMTLVIDPVKVKALISCPGKSVSAIEGIFKKMVGKGLDKTVEAVAVDMANGYPKLIREHLKADVVYDKFHILANFKRDVLVPAKRKAFAALPLRDPARQYVIGCERIILSPFDTLTPDGRTKLINLRKMNTLLSDMSVIPEQLRAVWDAADEREASITLGHVVELLSAAAKEHRFPAALRFAKLLLRHQQGILAYQTYHITTNIIEGMNNKIKVLKRKCYGIRNFKYFGLKIKELFPGKDYKPKLRRGVAVINGKWLSTRFIKNENLEWKLEDLPLDLKAV